MAQLSMRIDDSLKRDAERQFKAMGMSASAAVSIFFAQVVINHGLPFSVRADPFYDESNRIELERRAADMDAGINCHEHELLDITERTHA